MKKLALAALCLFAVSGVQAAEERSERFEGENGQQLGWGQKIGQWLDSSSSPFQRFDLKEGLGKFAAFGPFHFGCGEYPKDKQKLSTRNQAIAFKILVAGLATKWIFKKVKKYKKKKKKHHHK